MGVQAHSTSKIAPLPSLALSTGDYSTGTHGENSWRDRSGRGASIDNGVAVHLRALHSSTIENQMEVDRNTANSEARLMSENERLRRMISDQEKAIQALSDSTTPINELILNADLDSATREWLFVEFQSATFSGMSNATAMKASVNESAILGTREGTIAEIQKDCGTLSTVNITKLGTWEFDPWDFQGKDEEMVQVCKKIFEMFKITELCGIAARQLTQFMTKSFDAYKEQNPYHNKLHAFDVVHTSAVCMLAVPQTVLGPLDTLSVLVAATIHDIQHPGNTNAFEVNNQSELALMYNDTSVLESYSLNVAFRTILSSPESNLLSALGSEQRRYVRRAIINCVMATDMVNHFEAVSKLEETVIGTFSSGNAVLAEQKMCLLECIVHAADISNVCKSWNESELWSEAIASEFKSQGVKEKELGIPINPYGSDEMTETTARMCINFIDFVAGPLWVSLTAHLEKFDEPVGHMIYNRGKWMQKLTSHLESLGTEKARAEVQQLTRRTAAFHESFLSREIEDESLPTSVRSRLQSPAIAGSRRQSLVVNFMENMNKQKASARQLDLGPEASSMSSELRKGSYHRHSLMDLKEETEDGTEEKTNLTMLEMGQEKLAEGGTIIFGDQESNTKRGKEINVVVLPRQMMSAAAGPSSEEASEAHSFLDTLENVLEHNATQTAVAVLTAFALFGDDLRLSVAPAEWDDGFFTMTILTFLAFTVELFVRSYMSPSFRYGFFFWLDVVATVSLLPDIPWIWNLLISEDSGQSTESLNITRAGRASRAGAKAGRIVRIIRLVRLLRILKVYGLFVKERQRVDTKKKRMVKRYSRLVAKRASIERSTARHTDAESSFFSRSKDVHPESKVGAKLADMTTRRVILGVLCMLFITPFIDYVEFDESKEVGVGIVHAAALRTHYLNESVHEFSSLLETFAQGTPTLLYLQTNVPVAWGARAEPGAENVTIFLDRRTEETENIRLSRTRPTEFHEVFFGCNQDEALCDAGLLYLDGVAGDLLALDPEAALSDLDNSYGNLLCGCAEELTWAIFDLKAQSQETAARSILLTVFVIVLLGCGTMMFAKDAHELVINPIENMVKIVQELAENPLKKFDDESPKTHAGYETVLLENCIKKIGGLLQVGFGEAGAEIIATNMNGEGELDPMIPGKIVKAIFGVCDIHNFAATTDLLKTEVMIFVNEIANIVHTQVASYGGSANKNSGDSFLLVWKLPGSAAPPNTGTRATRRQVIKDGHKEERKWRELGDKSLMAFLKIVVEVSRNDALKRYADPADPLGSQILAALPGFRVELGFGLHLGWAVEGAIGSEKKIDASYLSPHVTLAHQLQAATRRYGTSIVMSGQYYNVLSLDAKRNSRKIDVVALECCPDPVALYTFDCITDDLDRKLHAVRLKGHNEFDMEEEDRRISIIGPNPIIDHTRYKHSVDKHAFRTDLEVRALQWDLPPHFLPLFRKAVRVYLDGKWLEAKKLLEATIQMCEKEKNGPSQVILEFMGQTGFVPPKDWKGYRALK